MVLPITRSGIPKATWQAALKATVYSKRRKMKVTEPWASRSIWKKQRWSMQPLHVAALPFKTTQWCSIVWHHSSKRVLKSLVCDLQTQWASSSGTCFQLLSPAIRKSSWLDVRLRALSQQLLRQIWTTTSFALLQVQLKSVTERKEIWLSKSCPPRTSLIIRLTQAWFRKTKVFGKSHWH